ncbi:MAG: PilX N-terminal domain-containing pilus assembly protein [Brachymonas sp.]
MKHSNVAPSIAQTPHAQRGTVLAITLILLVILSLLGTFAIRNANQSERIMNGIRTSNVAQQAAETALRFCEQLATAPPAGSGTFQSVDAATYINATAVSNANEGDWKNKDNWKSSNANLLSVPSSYYNSGSTDATELLHAPQCLIQALETPGGLKGYVITARGYANDAVIDASTGRVISGAEVWLQSTLTEAPTPPSP